MEEFKKWVNFITALGSEQPTKDGHLDKYD